MKKNTYVLLGVFVVLAVVAILMMNRPGETDVEAGNAKPLFAIDSASVDKIELQSPLAHVVLEKKGTDWTLTEPLMYRADQASIATIIHLAKTLAPRSVVSSNPEKRSIFQVDSTGTRVKIFEDGQERAAFVVGKPGESYTDNYVRKENSDDVLLVSGALTWSFNKPVKGWRDKTVLTVPKESITSIDYQYANEKFSLDFKDSVWLIGTNKVKTSEMPSLLSALSNIQADDFIDSTMSPAPKIIATISFGGSQVRICGTSDKNTFDVQTSSSPQWFEIQSWRVNQFLKHKKDLV
ncbi:MAG TPA: DUF4340 domain-containing protein [Bacteroidota bacterium]|nr:DUF4340 domain-containing protein [Bacteroidota bacterium]